MNFSSVREQWIRNKYVDRIFVKPLPNNEVLLEDFDMKKWSVYKERRRSPKCVQNTEKNDVMIFGGNIKNISLEDLSSDNESMISDEGKDS